MNFLKLISKRGFYTDPWLPPEVQQIILDHAVIRAYFIEVNMDLGNYRESQYYLSYGNRTNYFPLLPPRLFLHNNNSYYDIINIYITEKAVIGQNLKPLFKGDDKTTMLCENHLIQLKTDYGNVIDNINVDLADLHFESDYYGDNLDTCIYITKSNRSLTPPSLKFLHEYINHQYYSRCNDFGTSDFDTVDDTIRKLESELSILLKKLDDAKDLKKSIDKINLANSINKEHTNSSYIRQPYPDYPKQKYDPCPNYPSSRYEPYPCPDLIPVPMGWNNTVGTPLNPGEPLTHGTGNRTYIYKGSQPNSKDSNVDC